MDKNLKIAHCVQEYSPGIGGMAEVVRQLSERLVALGHEVVVFTSSHPQRNFDSLNGVSIKSFDLKGNVVEGIIGEPKPYVDAVSNGNFDVITLFAAQHWACDLLLPVLESLPCKKVFVPTGFSALKNPNYYAYFESMRNWIHSFDRCVFLSNTYQDIEFARACGVSKYVVIPNGASEEEFNTNSDWSVREALGLKDQRIILHVGSYTGIKGHIEALRIFLAADLKNAALLMIGAHNHYLKQALWRSPKLILLRLKLLLSRKRFYLVEWNRQQTIEAFKQSDIFLFPSMVECSPIVLFESMASGLPFLSSPAGNAEELVEWSSDAGKILPIEKSEDHYVHVKIEQSARILERSLNDPSWMKSASEAGRAAWLEKFTWGSIAGEYDRMYKEICKSI